MRMPGHHDLGLHGRAPQLGRPHTGMLPHHRHVHSIMGGTDLRQAQQSVMREINERARCRQGQGALWQKNALGLHGKCRWCRPQHHIKQRILIYWSQSGSRLGANHPAPCVCWFYNFQHSMFYTEHRIGQIMVIFRIIAAYTCWPLNLRDFC